MVQHCFIATQRVCLVCFLRGRVAGSAHVEALRPKTFFMRLDRRHAQVLTVVDHAFIADLPCIGTCAADLLRLGRIHGWLLLRGDHRDGADLRTHGRCRLRQTDCCCSLKQRWSDVLLPEGSCWSDCERTYFTYCLLLHCDSRCSGRAHASVPHRLRLPPRDAPLRPRGRRG